MSNNYKLINYEIMIKYNFNNDSKEKGIELTETLKELAKESIGCLFDQGNKSLDVLNKEDIDSSIIIERSISVSHIIGKEKPKKNAKTSKKRKR